MIFSIRLAENLVFLQLLRHDFSTAYWNGKREVDFIINVSGKPPFPINVTMGKEVSPREIEGIAEFCMNFNVKKGLILTDDRFGGEPDGMIKYVPLWIWLLEPVYII